MPQGMGVRVPPRAVFLFLERHLQTRVTREFFLTDVEAQKLLGSEMHGGRNMQDIEGAVAAFGRALDGIGRGEAQDGVHVARSDNIQARGDIGLPVGDHLVGLMTWVALGAVGGVEPDLELDGLEELKLQQAREVERFGHRLAVFECEWRVVLQSVNRAQKTGVSVSDHGSPVSKARISSTSAWVKTRSPQMRFRRAA